MVGAEQEKVSKEKAFANDEQKKVAVIAEDVGQKQKVCSIELAKAEPALLAAKAALDTLNKVSTSQNQVAIYGVIEIALKFVNKCLRRIVNVHWPDKIINRKLWNK